MAKGTAETLSLFRDTSRSRTFYLVEGEGYPGRGLWVPYIEACGSLQAQTGTFKKLEL
jgi:hypothetical protein